MSVFFQTETGVFAGRTMPFFPACCISSSLSKPFAFFRMTDLSPDVLAKADETVWRQCVRFERFVRTKGKTKSAAPDFSSNTTSGGVPSSGRQPPCCPACLLRLFFLYKFNTDVSPPASTHLSRPLSPAFAPCPKPSFFCNNKKSLKINNLKNTSPNEGQPANRKVKP